MHLKVLETSFEHPRTSVACPHQCHFSIHSGLCRVRVGQMCQGFILKGSFLLSIPDSMQREPWEQTSPDSLSQLDGACSDPLQALPASANCLPSHESGSISPYRSSGWTPAIPGAQPYPLHPLEDVHYSPSYAATSPYTFSPFMPVANELTSRMSHLPTEKSSETSPLHDNSAWAKDDGSPIWGTYEGQRTY